MPSFGSGHCCWNIERVGIVGWRSHGENGRLLREGVVDNPRCDLGGFVATGLDGTAQLSHFIEVFSKPWEAPNRQETLICFRLVAARSS
jgi:hypothetical protein